MLSERRLHPLSVLFGAAAALRAFLIPALLVLFAARSSAELWFGLLIFPSLGAAVIRYISYRYALTDDELVIRTGIFFRNERHIPYSRIHNIASIQNVFHRLLGVVEIRVETAGGAEPEARMKVLSVRERDEMREHVFRRKGEAATGEGEAAAPPPPAGRVILRLPLRELLLNGVIDNRGMVVVGAGLGLAYQLGLLDERRLPGAPRLTEAIRGLETIGRSTAWIGTMVLLLLGFFLLLRLFSMAWSVVTLHGFDLRTNGAELRTTYGLFTRTATAIPLHRIQLLSVRERPLQRLFRRVEVQADTAGGSPAEDRKERRPKLAPILRRARLPAFLGEVLPGVGARAASWRPVHRHAARRIFRISLAFGLLATGAAVALAGWWGAVALVPAVGVAALNAGRQARSRSWSVSEEAVFYRKGWIWKRLTVARIAKIQGLALVQTPFDRRWGMATLQVDTAGGGAGSDRLRVRFLEAGVAREALESLSDRVGSTVFRW
jgi:putative membrane protein